jgi:hypothetical protein
MAQQEKKVSKIKDKKSISPPMNDGTNTPVPSANTMQVHSANEAELLKQAENPLGDPNKV